MKAFFTNIYELFSGIYGRDLADHLYGLNPDNSGNTDARSLYVTVGVWMLTVTAAVVLAFYYWLNSAKYNRWYHWLGFMGLAAVINLFIGYYYPHLDVQAGNIADEIKVGIGESELWGFGFANALVSTVFFFIFSMLAQIKSRNCSNTPFALSSLFSKKK